MTTHPDTPDLQSVPALPPCHTFSTEHGQRFYTADQMKDFAAECCKVAVANYEAIHGAPIAAPEAVAPVAWIDDAGLRMLQRGHMPCVLHKRDDDFCHPLYAAAPPSPPLPESVREAPRADFKWWAEGLEEYMEWAGKPDEQPGIDDFNRCQELLAWIKKVTP